MIPTARSSASMYSQDSWKTNIESPFVCLVKVNPRRMAIAFSPSIQWSDIANMAEEYDDKEPTVKTPLVSSPSPPFIPQPDVSCSEIRDNDTNTHPKPDVVPTLASDADRESVGSFLDAGLPSLVEKMHTKIKSKSKKMNEQQSPKRSRSTKAFRKVMAHLTAQPPKRETAQLQRADTVATSNKFLLKDFKLPEFRVSPIRYSFIAQSNVYPSVLPKSRSPSSMTPSFDTLVVEQDGEDAVGVRQLYATMPPATSSEMKVHRRFQSSLSVPYFPRRDKDKHNMPLLPPVPAGPRKLTLSRPVNI